ESAERGYIITGEDAYVAPYQSAAQDIPRKQAELQKLTADNASQQERLANLGGLIGRRMEVLSEALRQRKERGFAAAEQVVDAGHGLEVMNQIRDASEAIEREEYRLLQQRENVRQARVRGGFVAGLVAALLAVMALSFAPLDVRRALRQRNVADAQKQESQSTAQSLFQSAAQAILIVDANGRILQANPATEKTFGYSRDELVGQSVDKLVPDALRGGHQAHRERYFRNPQNRPMGLGMDLQARRKDGSEFFVEISLSYIRSAGGTLGVAFVSDISKRRSDEQALRKQREDLRSLAGKLMTAQDDERRRIARDLHDDLSQTLAFLAMDLGKQAHQTSSPELTKEFRSLQKRAAEAAETVRRISHELHPSILDDIGLEAALEQYCEEFQERSGIRTRFSSKDVPDFLPSDVSSSVYHIAQECLRNVAKHSRAEEVVVELAASDGVLRLSVKDQGVGLGAEISATGKGIGIVGMKERAHLVNGNIFIHSKSGEGTAVEVEVPLSTGV
ncbi:MAG TPA: CHASE3 domain-containing protein, partial [Terriglobales bacterium]|nr:CHASE3 domain-containing protein [Terriglobales bacterium]